MEDKYLWLEDVQGDGALDWVKGQNAKSLTELKSEVGFAEIAAQFENILGNKDKIAFINTIHQNWVYNFWSDEKNLQGLWRRVSLEEYKKGNLVWEILLDLDELSTKDGQKWVFHGVDFSPSYKRALIFLSPGGSDADTMREFDLTSKTFVDQGFALPLSKGGASWLNEDEIVIHRDFGEGSLTKSGYPRTARKWKRGENLNQATQVFEIKASDNSVRSWSHKYLDKTEIVFSRSIDFYHSEVFLYDGNVLTKLPLPEQVSSMARQKDYFILQLASDWRVFKAGDCVAYYPTNDNTELIFSPDERSSVYSFTTLKDGLLMIIDRDVTSTLFYFSKSANQWTPSEIEMPKNGTIDSLVADDEGEDFFVSYSSFNSPLSYFHGKKDKISGKIKSMPSYFNHENIEVTQHFVKSLDGTMVPYFLVHQKGLVFNGKNPTILYGYGGFEVSLKPNFNNMLGCGWLERGGVYALSNIRGGGEYGPRWHQSALKANRDRAYQDFFAVAEDLINKKITSPDHLGAQGGSNGGLLMGVCYTQRPDLFKAINCGVPLLDMRRYHKLLAGFSWVAEYGNPDDDEDGRYIRNLSPYQRIEANEKNYPVIFLNTSTKDDRVHPGHARKFAARLEEFGHAYHYHENIHGGHAGASNFKELALMKALDYVFFWKHLK